VKKYLGQIYSTSPYQKKVLSLTAMHEKPRMVLNQSLKRPVHESLQILVTNDSKFGTLEKK